VWTIDLHVLRCELEGVAVRVAMIDESCSVLARLRSALVSRSAVLPVGAMCTIPVVSTLDVVDVVQRASPHGSHTTCIMLTSSIVHAVECYAATILSSMHPIPIRSLALHDACQQTLELHQRVQRVQREHLHHRLAGINGSPFTWGRFVWPL